MARHLLRSAVVLGLLSSIGPFAIDMYLPALPEIAAQLDTTVAATQTTLTGYFLAFGIAQMIYGPWADQSGRKVPLYVGLAIFLLGSIGCWLSPSIEWLTASRTVQGLGAAVLMVVPRAIIRDMHTGSEATRLMALIMLVISISPMLAPLAGSLIILFASWRGIFLALVVAGLIGLALTRFMLPETLADDARRPMNLKSMIRGCRILVTDRMFMGLTFIGGFAMSSFFVFIASASFVYTEQYGLSPMGFSLAFAINAVGFFSASQMAAPISDRIGMARTVSLGVTGFSIFSAILLFVTLAGWTTLPVLVGGLFISNACLGIVMPTTMVMALDNHGDIAGLASSLGGTLQMMVGGMMITIASPFFNGTATPMVAVIALCGLIAACISALVLGRFRLTPIE
ncbi:multidrug effflux MFS transporter [Qingshengfaniella alkalisoli]|uniref:Bcr/CflA family efflux transporter n=1 Tax=Qingshengfaniella alkalisoli TaxID=2599296 RepID=A0A5B8IZ85_9RHOB|nr:multidrug effflux MFS transporter [Qingshengfaniella alkalisoli]QDY70883.1 multidrug effflux MFS transporter [Qingshengfaniella alkalisoli]